MSQGRPPQKAETEFSRRAIHSTVPSKVTNTAGVVTKISEALEALPEQLSAREALELTRDAYERAHKRGHSKKYLNQLIGQQLNISEETVRTYFRKNKKKR